MHTRVKVQGSFITNVDDDYDDEDDGKEGQDDEIL